SHGDLGTLVRGDVLLAVSNSGESAEVLSLLPLARRLGLPLIAVCGHLESTLARSADVVLDVSVPEEACPLGLAPTASTTATMALGDALAIALLEERGFSAEDFALLHPGGALGRRLLRVEELMHRGGDVPLVPERAAFTDTLVEMTSKRLGVTGVVNGAGELVGVITDGDLRRKLERTVDLRTLSACDLMSTAPKTIGGGALGTAPHALLAAPRRLAVAHMGLAFPELELATRRRLVRETFRHAGQAFAELSLFEKILRRPDYVRLEGAEALDAALARGRGALAVTGHVGNWELLAAWAAAIGYPITVVVRRVNDLRFHSLIVRFRAAAGVEVLVRDDPRFVAAVGDALRRNRVVAMLID